MKLNIALNNKRQTADYRRYYNDFKLILIELILSQFEYKGLPDSIDGLYIEKALVLEGAQAAFFREPNTGVFVVTPSTGQDVGFYGIPINFQGISAIGNTYPIYYNRLDIKNLTGVIIYDNPLMLNRTFNTIDLYARRLANLLMNIDNHVRLTNIVPLILTLSLELKDAKNLMQGYDLNTPAIFVDRTFDPLSIKLIEFNKNYIGDKLSDLLHATWDDALKCCGIIRDYKLTKTERSITAEVNMANSELFEIAYSRLLERRKAIDVINSMYGLNILVDFRSMACNSEYVNNDSLTQVELNSEDGEDTNV